MPETPFGDEVQKNMYTLVLENLGAGMGSHSIIDFKMGTCSLTRKVKDP